MTTHTFESLPYGLPRTAKNGALYIEAPSGLFQKGDILDCHKPAKTGRRRAPAVDLVFSIDGLGDEFPNTDDDGYVTHWQRYYGAQQ